MSSTFAKGLEGVVAGETAICNVEQDALIYRGYEIADLTEHATFEEVAFLLLEGHKPSASELERFKGELVAERGIPEDLVAFLRTCREPLKAGTTVSMDVLRTAVSMLSHTDPESQDIGAEANLRKSKRLTAKIPTIIGAMQRIVDGEEPLEAGRGGDPELGHAANLLYMMRGERPTEEHARVLDVSLMLYAEHDYNASTFAARVIAGTLSDLHSAVTGAIAALKGPLHGGANEAALEMLKEIEAATDSPGDVEVWMQNAFQEKRKLMGFGHRVYKNGDHRAPILHVLGRELAEKAGPEAVKLFNLGERVQKIMVEEKGIHPNVDFSCGMTYYVMGIPVEQYTPIFVAARVTGWCAHVMEQLADNRLIRPRSVYTGPALSRWSG